MKRILAPIMMILVLAGCASNQDIVNIQSQIDTLKVVIEQVQINSLTAKVYAYGAAESSANAESSLIRTIEYTRKSNINIDRFLSELKKLLK